MLSTILALAALSPQATDLTSANYLDWIRFIQPSTSEQSYKDIAWRNEFWPAVQEARRLGRPILFWTMNGHPLGCT